MANVWVGTSGYSYKQWKGTFYPEDLPDAQMLGYYGARFNSVEINYTFYRFATVRQLQGWAKEVPDNFTFTLKAPRRITHEMRLRDAAEAAADFCEAASALKSKLGVLLFQLPPFLKRDVARLEDFLHQLPAGFRLVFEFRNATWFTDEVYDCLRRFGVSLCAVESDDRESPLASTAGFGYFRLRRGHYDDAALAATAQRILRASEGWSDVFAYFKHEAAGTSYAERLRALLIDGGAAVALPA
jgi:uncharacterized protein YecE (DUF72 family)